MKTKYLSFILILFTGVMLYGQKKKKSKGAEPGKVKQELSNVHIALTARSYGDSVVLRWGYQESFAFRTFNNAGFILERISLDKNNKVQETSFQKLTSQPIKPWPLEEWKNKGIEKDDYAAVAAQALYGKSFSVTEEMGEVEVMQNMSDDAILRHSFSMLAADISPLAAKGLGLRYVDKDVETGKKYIYRIYSPHNVEFFISDTTQFIVALDDKYIPIAPTGLNAIEGDKVIILNWSQEMYFSAYNIEKSTNNGKSFKKINERPFIKIKKDDKATEVTYVDSLDANYRTCIYRIAGISPFGDISPWSEPIKVMGRDRTPPAVPVIKKAELDKTGNVKIEWEMEEMAPDLRGYFIGTSNNVNGPFSPVHKKPLSKQTRTYIDKNPVKEGGRYYVVVSVDTAKNVQQSMPAYVFVPDDDPPAKPMGLSGEIDTTGLAKIFWQLGKENDLNGYRVYFSNQSDGPFMALSGTIQDTTFTDTISLNTLNQYIYYRLVAVDHSFNNSTYSDVLQLEIPDIIPPVAPVFKKYVVTDSTVHLEWYTSGSKDVVNQVLLRKEKGMEWVEIIELDANKSSYLDRNVEKNKTYEYQLIAIDDSELKSGESKMVRVKIYDSGIREEIKGFDVNLNQDKKAIDISWQPLNDQECHIMIYRSFNGDDLRMYTSVKATEKEFHDYTIQGKGTYKYSIRAIYNDGGMSPMTGIKKVVVN